MRRPLLSDVTIDEILELKAQGLTNKELAGLLDVSVPTIYRYLRARTVQHGDGSNASGKKADSPIKMLSCPPISVVEPDPPPACTLSMTSAVIGFTGQFGSYRLNPVSGAVTLRCSEESGTLRFQLSDVDKLWEDVAQLRAEMQRLNNVLKGRIKQGGGQ